MAVSKKGEVGKHVGVAEQELLPEKQVELQNFDEGVWQAHFNLELGLLLCGGVDGGASLHSSATGQQSFRWESVVQRPLGVALNPSARLALLGDEKGIIEVWDIDQAKILHTLEGHAASIRALAFSPDGQLALSGSLDMSLRLWDVLSGTCLQVLQGHTNSVWAVAFGTDGKHAISGSDDETIRHWDLTNGTSLGIFAGHSDAIRSLACNARHLLSGSYDGTVRLCDIASRECIRVFEGHQGRVDCVALHPDARHAVSGGSDGRVRLWDLHNGACMASIATHGEVRGVAFSQYGNTLFAVSLFGNLYQWQIADLLSTPRLSNQANPPDQTLYTNAKVLVVGDTHSGKTGLTERLARNTFTPSESTSGVWATHWPITPADNPTSQQREIWLWDFGGQADQRLIHQLYMDRCALILLLFDADRENILESLHEWRAALKRCVPENTPQLLIAGRVDVGFKASREKIQRFVNENGMLGLFETSAKLGEGCAALHQAILQAIDWERIERRSSPRIFKVIKDAILALREEKQVLYTFAELRQHLQLALLGESFDDATLKTVIGLLDGPGLVQELEYGDYILLKPEWINAYAQAVIRTLRADPQELGSLLVGSISEGKLLFQTMARDGQGAVEMTRLPPLEERVVLREMERQLEQRFLALRQDGQLIFPAHCGRERPSVPTHPNVFISYGITGYLDDIYATLVAKLAQSEAFTLDTLWRDAADFATLASDERMGIRMVEKDGDQARIKVYFSPGVAREEQVIFANYIHAHLHASHANPQRLREYVCPHCHEPKGKAEAMMRRLHDRGPLADTVCDDCDKKFPLWDDLEKLFASEELQQRMRALAARDEIILDARRKGKLLALEVGARLTRLDQKCFEIPGTEDEGIDMELEFTRGGKGKGKRLYLQLKAGNSHLRTRKSDGVEIFDIKEARWVEYWLQQPFPVMLVIGTFPDDYERSGKQKQPFEKVRWMEISSVLKNAAAGGKSLKHIEFIAENMDEDSILRWRDRICRGN